GLPELLVILATQSSRVRPLIRNRSASAALATSLAVGEKLCGPTVVTKLRTLACSPATFLVKQYKGGKETKTFGPSPSTCSHGSPCPPQPLKLPRRTAIRHKPNPLRPNQYFRTDFMFWFPRW